jgi:hypothetical protein
MIITKLDVTFDVADAIKYYKQVEETCKSIEWTMPPDYYVDTLRSMSGWSLTVPKDVDPEEPFGLYRSIQIMGIDSYQETKAAFGFGKALIDMLPMAYRVTLGLLPPGTYNAPHTDNSPDRDAMRGWVTFITDPGIKWITREGVADLSPGNVYIIDVAIEHEFINESNVTGVGMVFDILRSDYEAIKAISGKIK